MSRSPVLTAVAVLGCVIAAAVAGHVAATTARPVPATGSLITPAVRAAGLRFAPDVAPRDRAWILDAIAGARPEARRLIAEVDGTVTLETAGSGAMMGLTEPRAGGFRVWLNVRRLDGTRHMDRATTTLHELGHVIDFVLIGDDLASELDAGIPRGGPCLHQDGVAYGSCAAAPERLADTFAKWALGGSVSALGAGYGVAAPPSLEDWGRPLAELAASLPAG